MPVSERTKSCNVPTITNKITEQLPSETWTAAWKFSLTPFSTASVQLPVLKIIQAPQLAMGNGGSDRGDPRLISRVIVVGDDAYTMWRRRDGPVGS